MERAFRRLCPLGEVSKRAKRLNLRSLRCLLFNPFTNLGTECLNGPAICDFIRLLSLLPLPLCVAKSVSRRGAQNAEKYFVLISDLQESTMESGGGETFFAF